MSLPRDENRARRLAAEFDALERRDRNEIDALSAELRALGRQLNPSPVDFDAMWDRILDQADVGHDAPEDAEIDLPPDL